MQQTYYPNQDYSTENSYFPDPYNTGLQPISVIPPEGLNLIELGIVVFMILILIIVGTWGFFSQAAEIRDQNREADIVQVITALNNYYQNSSFIPGEKSYPIAVCSGRLNEIDFEYTLKQYLTGARVQFDTHPYILPKDYPQDNWGLYATTLSNKKTRLRECPKVFADLSNPEANIYSDETKSCEFDIARQQYRKCYLYTSSINGDYFEIAYFSEARQGFVIFSKFREDPVRTSLERI